MAPQPTEIAQNRLETGACGVDGSRATKKVAGVTEKSNCQAAGAFRACGHAGPRYRGFGAGRAFSRGWAPKPVTSEKIPPGDRTTNTDCESQGMAMPTLVGVIAETSAVEFFIVGNHSPDFCSVQENVRNS
jgi:hypothetical protein